MGWGTYYKHNGYLSRIGKNELHSKLDDLKDLNDMFWREILAYAASTPTARVKDDEGGEWMWQEFIANKIKNYRQEIEENDWLIAHINDCLEVLEERPDDVKEG